MGKKLIITEKPSVARDFARVLSVKGNRNGYIENETYVISWCYGHLVAMEYPESYDARLKTWRLEDLPFLPRDYKYGVIESAKEQYHIVNSLLHREDIDTVYWAGDSGKEGQTIEENIRNYGGVREGMDEKRVWIDSQTDDEIKRGIEEAKPMSEYALLGKSGIMRTIEDYSLGINFSRALSIKYGRLINKAANTQSYAAIAIGRVMTCVLGMVVKREREIRNFTETPFYRVVGTFDDVNFKAEWKSWEQSKYYNSPSLYKENGFKERENAEKLIDELSEKTAVIESIEQSITRKKAPLLFNLAELQSECSKIFKISPNETLQVIQDLYERKLTTYPRTDARVLTTAIAKEITKNLNGLKGYGEVADFVNEILGDRKYEKLEKTAYTDDSKVTDHYAIIPTGYVNGINSLDDIHKKVYDLIVRRFLAIFYLPAEYNNIKIQVLIDKERLSANAKALKNPGYMKVSGIVKPKESSDGDEGEELCSKEDMLRLADRLKKSDEVAVKGFEIKEGKTSPPKRYTSGNLILAMENAGNLIEDEELREQIKNTGIGTSATRGEILDKLVRNRYLNQNKKTQIITPEILGEMIYEVVVLTTPSLLNPEMTASWEKGLEGIINGTVDFDEYRLKLEDYIRTETNKMIKSDLSGELASNIDKFTADGGSVKVPHMMLDLPCPDCGGKLQTTTFGYGCSNYNNEEINCKFAVGKIAGRELSIDEFSSLIREGRTKVLEGFVGKNKKKFKAAITLKKEDGKSSIAFDFDEVGPEYLENVACPDCGGKIRIGAKGFGCDNYSKDNPDSCKFFIGTIASKELSQSDVIDLLKEGHTKTIRGFKSKNGKKFDSVLTLQKDETGKTTVGFDFENVEAKLLKDVKCPVCGADIEKTYYGYRCTKYKKDDPQGCIFSIGKMLGVKLNDTHIKELVTDGITSEIGGFKSKNGKVFSAQIGLKKDAQGKITGCEFVFDNHEEVVQEVKCPKCQKELLSTKRGYRCANYSREEGGCSFYCGEICKVLIPKEQFVKLIQTGSTDKISGFVSKKGSSFDATLKLDENNDIVFDF